MREIITRIDTKTGEPIVEERPALSVFYYEDGYTLLGTDLGGLGVKIELMHKHEGGGAVILPPHKAQECAQWLLRTLGQVNQSLSKELPDILERVIEQRGPAQVLKRGDKKKIKDALKVLRKQASRS